MLNIYLHRVLIQFFRLQLGDDSGEISIGQHRLTMADLESLDAPLLRQILAYLRAAKQQSNPFLFSLIAYLLVWDKND